MHRNVRPSERQRYTLNLIWLRSAIRCRSLLVLWVLFPIAAIAQFRLDALPDCASPQQHRSCVVTIDRLHPVSPGTIRVWNGTEVIVRVVNKSPFDTCRFVQKDDPLISTRDDQLALSLLDLHKAGILLPGVDVSVGDSSTAPSAPESAPIETNLDTALNELIATEERLHRFLNTQYVGSRYSTVGLFIPRKAPLSDNDFRDRNLFDTEATATVGQARASLAVASRASISAGNRLEQLNRLIDGKPLGQASLNENDKHLSSQVALVKRLFAIYQVIENAQQVVAEVLSNIESTRQPEFETSISLPGEDSTTTSGILECREKRTLKQTFGPVPLTVVFRDVPWLVTTVGLAFPNIPSRDFRVQAAPQSVGQNLFVITDRTSRPQVLPFVFLNAKIREFKFGGKQYAINVGPGVGVSSQGQPQFAVVPSASVGRLYAGLGMHIARSTKLINGYHVGDIVQQSFSPPTSPTWEVGFNLSVSYRILPLH
jgi:hypothetical protein